MSVAVTGSVWPGKEQCFRIQNATEAGPACLRINGELCRMAVVRSCTIQ